MATTSDRRAGWWIVAVALLAVVAAATAGVIVLKGGSSSAGASVLLEPAGSTGTDPFTASVAIGPAVEFPGNVLAVAAATRKSFPSDPKTHTIVASGTAPGLYGGSGDAHLCEPQQIVKFLGQNPGKAAAWAGVLGISTAGIAQYVGSLTPVVLTSDTLVTNHGYRNGRATTLQSVLQAGTAVMVDATGTPRVKCNCGNPLTPPEPITPTNTRGPAWPGYTPTQVAVVTPGPTITEIIVLNIKTGDTYTTPTGSDTGEWVAVEGAPGTPQSTIVASADGQKWATMTTLPGQVQGLAWGNGKWLASQDNHSGTGAGSVLESTDLRTWHQAATTPVLLEDIAYGNGRWVGVGGEADAGDCCGHGVVYTSSDGSTWTRTAAVLDAGDGLNSVAYGNGSWIAIDEGHQGGDRSNTYRSTDTTHWSRDNDQGLDTQAAGSHVAYGSGQWALGGAVVDLGSSTSGVVSLSPDARTWTPVPGAPFTGNVVTGVAYGNGEWMVVGGSTALTSADGTTWATKGHLDAAASDLAFGGTTGSATPPPASTTTTQPASATSLRNIVWKNYTYKDLVCATGKPVHFTNGEWVAPVSAGSCGEGFTAVDFADVTGDGVEDAIVNIAANASGVAEGQSWWTTVFTAGPSGPVNHGYISGSSYPPYSASGLTTWFPELGSGQFTCCPTLVEKDTYAYTRSSGTFTKTGGTSLPIGQQPKR